MSAKEQIGRLESLLDRVRSRARHAGAASASAAAAGDALSDLAVPVVAAAHAAPVASAASAASAATPAPTPPRRPSVAPPLPPQALGHAAHVPVAQAAQAAQAAPDSAAPSTMEIGAEDMIESVSPVQAAARAPSEAPPSSRVPASRHETTPPSASDDIDVDVTEDEVEQPAPSSARRPKSERAHALHTNPNEEPQRPQTMPPESGRQVASSASPSVPAESGKRASVPAAAFDAHAEAAQTNQTASGRAASTNPAAFIGSPRRAAATFGELLDTALSL